jgi:alkanesulfonate monooxygenase SsuD/methylene tetrahydromethanopterin reductase-like flavin-dependent oxidoreductase (luciferase family)
VIGRRRRHGDLLRQAEKGDFERVGTAHSFTAPSRSAAAWLNSRGPSTWSAAAAMPSLLRILKQIA